MSSASSSTDGGRFSITDIFRIVVEGQTYKNLVYLVLAFPLGFLYGTIVGFGFVFGFILTIFGIGVAILFVTLVGTRLVAQFERWLANALLDLTIHEPDDRSKATGIWATVKSYLDAPSTWRGLGFLTIRFWFGIVGFFILFMFWNAVELATAPLRYPVEIEFGTVNDQPVVWAIASLPDALLAAPIGVALVFVSLHISNGFAYVSERVALALLDG